MPDDVPSFAISAVETGTKATNTNKASIDTRTIFPGQVFIAIEGDNFNGHEFLEEALSMGAFGLIVNRSFKGNLIAITITRNLRFING